MDSKVIEALRERRFDFAPVSNDSAEYGWGLVSREVLEQLLAAGRPLELMSIDTTARSIKVLDGDGLVSLQALFEFFSESASVLIVEGHSAGTDPTREGVSRAVGRIGLVNLADLNHREVRRAAYEFLLDVELALVDVLRRDHNDPWLWIDSIASEDERARLLGYWELMRRRGVDHTPEILLTLPQLLGIVGKSGELRAKLGLKSRTDLENRVKGVVELRNRTMHPVRPLVSAPEDVARFAGTISALAALLQRMRVCS